MPSERIEGVSQIHPPGAGGVGPSSVNHLTEAVHELSQRLERLESRLGRRRGVLSSDAIDLLNLLESESGQTGEEVLIKSLSLYRQALKAERLGQKVAIIDPDDTIVREFSGFHEPLRISTPVGEY